MISNAVTDAAKFLGLPCTEVEITPEEIESALPTVIAAIPEKDPVNTSIAVTMYFVAQWAGEHGYQRILAGQGADRALRRLCPVPPHPNAGRGSCRGTLPGWNYQADRDQAVAALHGTYLSMPYLDIRVMRAACAIPAHEKVCNGQRKIPLAVRLQSAISRQNWQDTSKKAMQYGSGVWGNTKKDCP